MVEASSRQISQGHRSRSVSFTGIGLWFERRGRALLTLPEGRGPNARGGTLDKDRRMLRGDTGIVELGAEEATAT